MSDLYGQERGVESARRGYLFVDGRSSLVIRDEVKLTRESLVRWHMTTDALIEVQGNIATLRDKDDPGKYITVEFMANCDIEVGSERALPLETSPVIPEQNKNEGFYRLYAKALSDGEFTLTVKINARHTEVSALAEYDESIDEWKV